MSTELRSARGSWERYLAWGSIVSMLRQQPGIWVAIGSGQLTADLRSDLVQKIRIADPRADAAQYEVRSSAATDDSNVIEARLVS